MESGDFYELIELVTEHAERPEEFASLEDYQDHEVAFLTLQLMRRMISASELNDKWASIEVKGDRMRAGQQNTARLILGRVGNILGAEGFPVDIAVDTYDENFVLQITAFWQDGKQIYEDLGLLGKVNPQFLTEAESPRSIHEYIPFRPYIVKPRP